MSVIVRNRACSECGTRYEARFRRRLKKGAGGRNSDDFEEERVDDGCPDCESMEADWLPSAPAPVALGDVAGVGKIYPYYDRGLQLQINNAQHRKQVAKERNVTPVDGDFDAGRAARQARAKREDAKARYRKVKRDMEREMPGIYARADASAKKLKAKHERATKLAKERRTDSIRKAKHDDARSL